MLEEMKLRTKTTFKINPIMAGLFQEFQVLEDGRGGHSNHMNVLYCSESIGLREM